MIAKRRAILDRLENWIRSANSREAVRTCRDKNRAANQQLKEKRQQMKEKFRAEKQRRKQQRRQEMEWFPFARFLFTDSFKNF